MRDQERFDYIDEILADRDEEPGDAIENLHILDTRLDALRDLVIKCIFHGWTPADLTQLQNWFRYQEDPMTPLTPREREAVAEIDNLLALAPEPEPPTLPEPMAIPNEMLFGQVPVQANPNLRATEWHIANPGQFYTWDIETPALRGDDD